MDKQQMILTLSSIGEKVQSATTFLFEALSFVVVALFLVSVAVGALIWLGHGTEPFREYIALTIEYWASFPLPGIRQG